MRSLMEKVRSLFTPQPEAEALDGNAEVLRSGKWSAHQFIPVESFPLALMLNETDRSLHGKASEQVVLGATKVGSHQVEVLLWAPDSDSVGLGLRIPTASNQYKEPYLLMEAEAGNSREDTVRDIQFHLQGRCNEADISHVDWAAFLKTAAMKLEALRTLP